MNLFPNEQNEQINILPFDGNVIYFGKIFSPSQESLFQNHLQNDILWQNDEAMMFGKKIITKRKVAWYGEKDFEYTYSKLTKKALPWTEKLIALKQLVETATNERFNSCLLNLYHNGSEGMGWHSDNEKDLKPNGAIASISFGAERKFAFKHKETKRLVNIVLQHGSLLLMKDTTQKYWMHRLPPTKVAHQHRFNLTFRTILE